MKLVTERLVLTPWTVDELDDFHRLWSDPKTIWWGANASIGQSREMLERIITQPTWWAVRREGEFLGNAFLRQSPRRTGVLELGYHFSSTTWGHGYATEAARALLETVPHQLIEAPVVPENTRSQRVMKKLGFSIVGQLMHFERLHDLWERAAS
ncbi:MAG: GNAT family N-acetyltransferase [Archangiaceae bacterium]|nr:GNAT family N-acetyltransferase [Archangiaceae bacterium]